MVFPPVFASIFRHTAAESKMPPGKSRPGMGRKYFGKSLCPRFFPACLKIPHLRMRAGGCIVTAIQKTE